MHFAKGDSRRKAFLSHLIACYTTSFLRPSQPLDLTSSAMLSCLTSWQNATYRPTTKSPFLQLSFYHAKNSITPSFRPLALVLLSMVFCNILGRKLGSLRKRTGSIKTHKKFGRSVLVYRLSLSLCHLAAEKLVSIFVKKCICKLSPARSIWQEKCSKTKHTMILYYIYTLSPYIYIRWTKAVFLKEELHPMTKGKDKCDAKVQSS